MDNETVKKYQSYLDAELNSAAIYHALSGFSKDERVKDVYERMAVVEEKHARKWTELLQEAGGNPPAFKLSTKTKILIWIAKRFGPEMILPSLQAMEKTGGSEYDAIEVANGMGVQERTHSIVLKQLSKSSSGGVKGVQGSMVAQLEGRHRSTGGNALRAAVLGANDGLVSNLSLVMGVAGASMNNKSILIAGIAGLLAGACSMALGEWLSVQSSRELYSHQIQIEKEEIEQSPEEEAEELALIYESRGLNREQATTLANQILKDSDSALDTLAREELGIDPEELGGSAWEAAITSFILFAIGAVIPVISFTFLNGLNAVLVSVALSTVGLFLLGAAITLFTGRSVISSGTRMVAFGLLAAAVTFGIGRLIGVSITG